MLDLTAFEDVDHVKAAWIINPLTTQRQHESRFIVDAKICFGSNKFDK